MVQLSKQTQDFLKNVGDRTKVLTSIPASADRITPGNLLIFRYWMEPIRAGRKQRLGTRGQRTVLIVKCKRGDGIFISNKNNLLVSCFKLEGKSEVIIETIIENLYKKRRKASYWGFIKQSLIKILGINSFRTYKFSQMKSIYKVSLKQPRS
tara:strand:- start:6916 stop:7371 length:456 start_codon:yes stop_codon:yes gene_type:complete